MSHCKRAAVLTACFVIALSILASSAFLSFGIVHCHMCVDEQCRICRFVAQIEQLRQVFDPVVLVLLAMAFLQAMRRDWRANGTADRPLFEPLTERRIRLNN